jgi:hypothetical protein
MPKKYLSIIFAATFFLSTLVMVSHHHADESDHHDCPECIALHHSKSADIGYACIDLSPEAASTSYVIPQTKQHLPVRQINPSEIRPPPA